MNLIQEKLNERVISILLVVFLAPTRGIPDPDMVNAEKPTNKSIVSLYLHWIPAHVEISEIEAADAEKLKEQIMSSISLSDSKPRRVMERYVTLHLASMASRSHVSLRQASRVIG